jgi:phosphoribosylglycinamide formyltransferase 1
MKKLAIFVSGSGTNMQNLINDCHNGRIPAQVGVVICDNPEAKAIARARNYGVTVIVIDRKQFQDKAAFEAEIIRAVDQAKADYLVLAGFMRILSCDFVRKYKGKIINIHPSLLPAFPGAHGIKDAFEAKVSETGVTIHWVDEGVDTGPVILQEKIAIAPEDTLETLEEKVHAIEYRLYPEALRKVLKREIKYQENVTRSPDTSHQKKQES